MVSSQEDEMNKASWKGRGGTPVSSSYVCSPEPATNPLSGNSALDL